MVSYFLGGSIGTFLATLLWKNYQWNGVCAIGAAISVITLIIHFANHPKEEFKNQGSRVRNHTI